MTSVRLTRVVPGLLFVAAYTASSALGAMFENADGVSIWWPPAAVLVVWLLSDRPSRTVPVALAGRVVSGLVVTGFDRAAIPRILVAGAAVVTAYALAVHVHRRLVGTEGARSSSLRTTLSVVVLLGLAAPASAALGSRGALVVAGIASWEGVASTVVAFTIGDAAAILTLVPLANLLMTGRPEAAAVRSALPTTIVAAALSWVALDWTVGGESVVFLVAVPAMLAALHRRGDVAVPFVLAATGAAVALGFADASTTDALPVQVDVVLIAAVTLLAAGALRSGPPRRTRVESRVGEVVVPGEDDFLRGFGGLVRRARVVGAVIEVLYVLSALRGGWDGAPLPLWLAALVAPGMFLASNAVSVYLDAAHGYGRRRQLVESALDLTVIVTLFTVLAPLQPFMVVPMGLIAVLAVVALRLPMRDALTASLAAVTVLTAVRLGAPLPWPVAPPDHSMADVVPLVGTAVLMVWLLSWASTQLHEYRQIAAAAGESQLRHVLRTEQLNAELAGRNDELEALTGELRATVSRLDHAAAQERAAREAYERFAAVVAHDVRGPLATIAAIASTLDRPMDEAVDSDLRGRIGSSARRTLRLVERLHEHAAVGAATLDARPADLGVIVREAVADLSAATERSGSSVRVTDLLPTVVCDAEMVRQLVQNLLGNALRHGVGPDGAATVTISSQQTDDGVLVSVSDEGGGIDADVSERLFELGATTDRRRGLGLGLSTARDIVHRHGGRIWVDQTGPTGTTMCFLLPSVASPTRVVLVVDDDADQRLAHRVALTAGVAPVTVLEADGVEAARAVMGATDRIDEAIVDLQLADGHGIALVDELRARGTRVRLVAAPAASPDRTDAAEPGVVVTHGDAVVEGRHAPATVVAEQG